jgi:hypothetical protein
MANASAQVRRAARYVTTSNSEKGFGTGHCMKADMLASHFAALEEPSNALAVEISQSPGTIVGQIVAELRRAAHADMAGSRDRWKGKA